MKKYTYLKLKKRLILSYLLSLLSLATSCTYQIKIPENTYPFPSQKRLRIKATNLANRTQTSFGDLMGSRYLNQAFEKMLSTQEGRDVFVSSPENVTIKSFSFSKENRKTIGLFAFNRTIGVNKDLISDENINLLSILLPHEFEHLNQPKIPKGLTFDQYATLYKLMEVDAHLTAMQAYAESNFKKPSLLGKVYDYYKNVFRENLSHYNKNIKEREKAYTLAKYRTKAYFFKEYMNNDEASFIDPHWKKGYEDRLFKSVLSGKRHLKTPQEQKSEDQIAYTNSLDFYLNRCGGFLKKSDINSSGISSKNKKADLIRKAIRLRFASKKGPESFLEYYKKAEQSNHLRRINYPIQTTSKTHFQRQKIRID